MECLRKLVLEHLARDFTLLWLIPAYNSGPCQNADLIGSGRNLGSAQMRQWGDVALRIWLQALSWLNIQLYILYFIISMWHLRFAFPPNQGFEAKNCLVVKPQKWLAPEAVFKPPCPSASSWPGAAWSLLLFLFLLSEITWSRGSIAAPTSFLRLLLFCMMISAKPIKKFSI